MAYILLIYKTLLMINKMKNFRMWHTFTQKLEFSVILKILQRYYNCQMHCLNKFHYPNSRVIIICFTENKGFFLINRLFS